MSKCFVIDIAKCNGFYNCQLACKDEHVDNDWTPYSRPQPDVGQFWIKIKENVCGTMTKVKIHYIPKLCNHCRDAPCIEACAAGAIYRRDDGLVLINPQECTGCKDCISACPYEGVIYFNEDLDIAQKCTGCAHLRDNGIELPRCVETCPTEAMRFGEEEELRELIAGATVLSPGTGAGPRVYYRNIPGQFIAGTVYDTVEEEVIIGARCRMSTGGKTMETVTDDYGDFWFNDLAIGIYDLAIEAQGSQGKYVKDLYTDKCINLGDIPLEKSVKI